MTASWGYRDRLPKDRERDGPYIFDSSEAKRALSFFERRVYIAEGEKASQHYITPDWQKHWLSALYGWRRDVPMSSSRVATIRAKRPRRYRRALTAIPRGNLKSSLGGGVALKSMVADGFPRPMVVGAGTDKKNAAIIFGYGSYSVERDRELSKRLEVIAGKSPTSVTKVIRRRDGNGDYVVIAAKETHQHGGHPTHIIVDDLQAQPRPGLLKVLRTSQITLADSLFAMFMTANFTGKAGPGWEEWEHGLLLEEDPSLDPEYLVAMYYAKPDSDFEDERLWLEVNPSLGVSIRPEEIRKAVRDMVTRPSLRGEVLALHFNVWDDAAESTWIAPEQWKRNARAVDESKLAGRSCRAAIVATSSTDIASVAYVFPPALAGDPWQVILDAFVPKLCVERLEEASKITFGPFIDQGWMTETEGDVINEAFIADSVARRRSQGWQIVDVTANPRGAVGLITRLQALGFRVASLTPSYGTMSAAMNEWERMVLAREIAHGGDHALAWMMRNLRVRRSGMGDVMPDGEHSPGNITGAVAALMALARQIGPKDETKQTQRWGAA